MTIYLMSGLPGSGKTTWLNEHAKDGYVIHRDDVRDELRKTLKSGDYYPCSKSAEYDHWITEVVKCIKSHPGKDIYCDQTTLNAAAAHKFMSELFKKFDFISAGYNFTIIVMDTPLAVCEERNNKRRGFAKVPKNVLARMAKNFKMNDACFKKIPDIYKHLFHIRII